MKTTVHWQGDMRFEGITDTGYTTQMDGDGKAISPMESVLVAVGACSSVDVVEIMKKSRIDLRSCRCELQAQRSETAPRVFESIHAHYVVRGEGIKEHQIARAVKLSAEKYCSVMLMLHGSVNITTSYAIEEIA
ncbi:OsmC family protein [Alteromonas oceanisediminis]|uniref:OsmC family protein n=1 Tax=Alteromonas oceanisediminis TaxID=2836180 RepID=UPI001BDB23CC|nr:OsmC family protein [Alteromonas oceanisediminis]MBT0586412.1 OsmC family protein [Alteromonas oceanisediminis]